jgi:hypothetical protein
MFFWKIKILWVVKPLARGSGNGVHLVFFSTKQASKQTNKRSGTSAVLKHPVQDALKTLNLKKLGRKPKQNIAPHASPSSCVSINLANLELVRKLGCNGHTFKRTSKWFQRLKKPHKGDDTTRIRRWVASTSAKEARASAIKKEEVSKQFERRKKSRRSLKGGA